MILENKDYIGKRVKVRNTHTKKYRQERIIGCCGEVVKVSGGSIGVKIDGMYNDGSSVGLYWFEKSELKIIDNESEDIKMTGFNKVAIVNLLEDYGNKDYGFALYDSEYDLLQGFEQEDILVVVNAGSKDSRKLGAVKEVMTVEDYGKNVTAQVVGVVNIKAYNDRIEEENRQKEIKKQKAAIEKELKSEIEKMNNIALYEKMASEHPENTRLGELVAALKELGE